MIYIVNLKVTIKTIDPEDKYNLPVRVVKELDLVEHGRSLKESVDIELEALGEWLSANVPPEDGKPNLLVMPGGGKFPQKEKKPI